MSDEKLVLVRVMAGVRPVLTFFAGATDSGKELMARAKFIGKRTGRTLPRNARVTIAR